jgi:hypothetical protein
VKSIPLLPVVHDTEVKILCLPKHVNFGKKQVYCRDGHLMTFGKDLVPDCRKMGKTSSFISLA